MIQYFCAVVLGAIVYTIGFAIIDAEFMPFAGFFFSLLVAGIFVLPLRALLKFALPQAAQRSRALITISTLMALVTFATFNILPEHLPSGRLGFFLFWFVYLSTLVAALFWPLSAIPADPPAPARTARITPMENTSGQGASAPVPIEVDRWNWGAFLLNWIWGIGNNTYVALLMFVPFVNIVMLFMLGAKGSAWAWRNQRWDSIEHFQRTQRNWARWGLAVYAGVFVLGFAVAAITLRQSVAYQLGVAELQSNTEANAVLGTPIIAGFPMGQIEVSGDTGSAELSFGAEGPHATGKVHLVASKRDGQWMLERIELDVDGQPRIQLGQKSPESGSQ